MNLSTRNKIILGAVTLIVLINFVLIPTINRQRAANVVQTILKLWIAEDYASPLKHFYEPEKSPPVYGLQSYEIKNLSMIKANGALTAKFSIILNFANKNIFPSGKLWLFELQQLGRHWMVMKYYIL